MKIRAIVAVALQIALAALGFMWITQSAQIVVTRGLGLMGLRTDIPTVISIEGCGERIETNRADWKAGLELFAPAQAPSSSRHSVPRLCEDGWSGRTVTINATVPSGHKVSLIVNGSKVDERATAAAVISFESIKLRQGLNLIAVADGDDAAMTLRYEQNIDSYWRSVLGYFPQPRLGAPVSILLGPDEPTASSTVGFWGLPSQKPLLLMLGTPFDRATGPSSLDTGQFGADGIAIFEVSRIPTNLPELTPDQFRRSIEISRGGDNELAIKASACLPPDSRLVQLADRGQLSPAEFIATMGGLRINPSRGEGHEHYPPLTSKPGTSCTLLQASVSMPAGYIDKSGPFPQAPTDDLTIKGLALREGPTRSPTEVSGNDTIFFAGGGSGSTDLDFSLTWWPSRSNDYTPPQGNHGAYGGSQSRLAVAWAQFEGRLPSWLSVALAALASVAPTLLLIWAVSRAGRHDALVNAGGVRVLPGLYAYMLLAFATLAQPLFYQAYLWLSDGLQALLATSRADGAPSSTDPYTAMAFGVAFLLTPFLGATAAPASSKRQGTVGAVVAFVATAAAIGVLLGLIVLQSMPWGDADWNESLYGRWLPDLTLPTSAVGPITLIALLVAMTTAWIPLWWIFRTLVSSRGRLLTIVLTGAAVVVLPMVTYLVEAVRIMVAVPQNDYAEGRPSFVVILTSGLLPFMLFFVLLRAIRAVAISVVPENWAKPVKKYLSGPILLIVAAILTLPWIGQAPRPGSFDASVVGVLGVFQSFGAVIAALAAVGILVGDNKAPALGADIQSFHFTASEMLIITVVYAGFLSLWTDEPLATLVAISVAWAAFRFIVLDDKITLPDALATPEMAQNLVELREEAALLAAREKAAEDEFSKGKITYAQLTELRANLDTIRFSHEAGLKLDQKEAKRRLLGFGPGNSPFANGTLGALAGAAFATALQLATSLQGPQVEGAGKTLADLVWRAFRDPVYSVARSGTDRIAQASFDSGPPPSPDLLLFVGALINAYFLWVMIGFLFGFVYHRIRGSDGVVKAVTFTLGIGVTYTVSQLFAVYTSGDIMRMVPVGLFLLFTGVVVFDVRSLMTRGLSWVRLLDIYGFRTILGYASAFGAIVSLQPLLEFVRQLFKQ